MVNRNQNVDNVIRQIRHDDMAANNNQAALVERIVVRNGVNFFLRRPNYTSHLSEYVLQPETPPRTKIPKFTKFFGDTTESTVEHVARYLIEAGDISNNENLRIKYFPSSLTKNSFMWFTTLPQHSIHTWNQLETMFHEQFYTGQIKISLKELANFDENEIDLAELKQGPPYACKVLAPSNGKNPIEPENNDKFPKKTYTFDVTKYDEIFDLLVKDGQMIVPSGAKVPPLEQRKKIRFCKYHSFLGHKTSQCFLFRDLVQNAIQEGRLKFGDKPRSQMKIDSNPL
ncbi:uncharacterized protein LOC127094047 [Lathyrus oleraceus]|uniref:uncharacterized protein LOC127094047 n=1 Tax=Pisum sativum TaxID=3888 RepID=UPI0021D2040D|nr:uncharacterized protein LOC127094047 [Pisum sativum]